MLSLSTYFAGRVFPNSMCWVHLETMTVRKTDVLAKEFVIALAAVDKFLVWVRKSTHQVIETVHGLRILLGLCTK
jgi:hypothetical protein